MTERKLAGAKEHRADSRRITSLFLLPLLLVPAVFTQGWADSPDPNGEHPPIDCPLRRAGVDPTGVKPFEDAALGLIGDEIVADVGSGSGYFTIRLAESLPQGKVVAIDIEPEMVRHVHHKVVNEKLTNIEAVLTTADEPRVPANADLVFICDVLHHVRDRQAWLTKLTSTLKDDAELVLIEFKEGDLPNGPPADLKISRAKMIELATSAGLSLRNEMPDLLPYQTFLIFEKAR